ncbi:MAG: putative lipoprotein [Polaromonas sp.]|nr:putative lipoprotein [Polaromonas sp.]
MTTTMPSSNLYDAMKSRAACAGRYCARAVSALTVGALVLLAGCALTDKPSRAMMYDFGPGALATEAAAAPSAGAPAKPAGALRPLALTDVATSGGALENQAVLYRLNYTDAQQLLPYSKARWTMPPAQLVRQRLRERLGRNRVMLDAREGVALNRTQNPNLQTLRLELEEFSQLFSAPDASVGLIRLHVTLSEVTPTGERLVAQRSLAVQRPAPSADAAGGVRALTAATDAAIDELDQWLQQAPAR